jgi:hypothetical protein
MNTTTRIPIITNDEFLIVFLFNVLYSKGGKITIRRQKWLSGTR